LVDTIREGKAPEVIRRRGAEGALPVSLDEKVEILACLSTDPDESIRNTAFYTLETYDVMELSEVFANPSTPLPVLDFASTQLVPKRRELAPGLLSNPALPTDLHEFIQNHLKRFAEQVITPAPEPDKAKDGKEASEAQRETLIQKINRMTVAEKIKMALTGSQDERVILIRDSNKVIARAVLESPKVSDQEIENIATMKNVTEEVLRIVAMNRRFIKSYSVARALLNNPRTPIDVGLPLLNRMNDRDLKGLAINKNVAEVLRSMATKIIKQKEDAKKVKIPGKH
jgi:hypothetical protein